ncbi:MAG: hypothetical protein AMJ68_09310 [Acidithiobacillales bacterium SG8_45]|nr:MAG: hypothetical protein AMJ68_09310 [Acidithiobacillales bacterium SG8_45]
MLKNRSTRFIDYLVLSIFFVLTSAIGFTLPLDSKIQTTIPFWAIIISFICYYLWQTNEWDDLKSSALVTIFGLIWTVAGFYIGAVIYNAPCSEIMFLKSEAWNQMGYLGPLAIGPFAAIAGIVFMFRSLLLRLKNY